MTYLPRGLAFYTCGTELEGNLKPGNRCTAAYAAVGTGSLVLRSTPTLYEGVNEKGLMGGQLYFREFAGYSGQARPGTQPIQPPFLVTYCLTTCASVEEVIDALEHRVSLVAVPMLGSVPSIHWMFSDRTGASIIVESERDGLHIYRDTVGVMTNSPSYSWHRTNLLNYPQVWDRDYGEAAWGGETLTPCFSGSGAIGLPGDWSSPSRFVRLAFLRRYALKGRNEAEGVAYLFRLLGSVAFPLGVVRLNDLGAITEHDQDVLPYDFTLYSAVLCAESMRFYWTTYRNAHIRYVDLGKLMEQGQPVQIPLEGGSCFEEQTAAF